VKGNIILWCGPASSARLFWRPSPVPQWAAVGFARSLYDVLQHEYVV